MRIHTALPGTALKNKKNKNPLYYIKKFSNIVLQTSVFAFRRQYLLSFRLIISNIQNNFFLRNILKLGNHTAQVF
jgi:hypothetical protein